MRGEALTDRLAEKQMRLVETEEKLREAELRVDAVRAELAQARDLAEDEARRFAMAEDEIARLELELIGAQTEREGLAQTLDSVTTALGDVVTARDAAAGEVRSLTTRVATLETEIVRWETRQERVMVQLEDAARISLSGLDRMFDASNVDIDAILEVTRREYSGAGGPFEPIADVVPTAPEDVRVAALMSDLERVNLMRIAAERLPYGQPVTAAARLTSTFGPRRDPFGRGVAMHKGIDLAAPIGTPIYATAEGVVTFSGRQRGYGIVVKIRHAFGFETVYAHLNKTRVEVGQQVTRGDRIGDMGSTGRSTGSHLHYEIRIDGEAVNPLKFIEAARDVL